MFHDRDASYPEHRGQLIRRYLERARSRADAREGLWVRRRTGGVERHVALDLLHDLMNVSVQHRDRSETTQLIHELVRITRTPAPGLVDRPERHMCEHDDRRAGRSMFQVRGHPIELFSTQRAETTWLELQDVDQGNEM